MVPVEPTMEMCEAGWNEYDLQEHFSVRFMYERMIAAALTPPVSEDRKDAPQEDYFADACRLALELECLLLDCKDTAVTAKWWASANEALEQHRALIDALKGE